MAKILQLLVGLICFGSLSAFGADSLSYSGRLVNANGSPVSGPVKLKFDLAYTNDLTVIKCTQQINNIDLINGVFHAKLNLDCSPLTLTEVLENIPLNNSIAIRVTDLTPSTPKVYSYQALHSLPFSIMSEMSKQLVQMGASAGQVLTWNGTQWAPADPAGTMGGVTTIVGSDGMSAVRVDDTVTVGIVDGGVTAAKLDQMGAASGQVLKWTGTAWAPAADVDTGLTTEVDPTVRAFARNDVTGIAPEICNNNQVLRYISVDNSLRCFDLVDDAIVNGETNKAPSQNAVFDALALKQNTIDNNSELMMKSVRVTNDGATWVGVKAPNAAGNLYFTLPAVAGVDGQVLKTDGAGNLSWVTPSTNSAGIVDGSIVDADIAAGANIAQAKIFGLTSSLTNLQNSITSLTTDDVAEGSRLYFTEAKVLGTDLAGLDNTNGAITSADTVLSSIGKLIGNLAMVSTSQSNYVLKSGDTMSGNLQMGGFAVSGLAAPTIDSDAATKKYVDDSKLMTKLNSYAVPSGSSAVITLPTGGTSLNNGWAYKFQLAIQATATATGASYIVYQTGVGVWAAKLVSANGNTSNHPLLQISGTNVQVYHNHGSTYTIGVISEAFQTNNTTVLSPQFFGLEGAMTNLAGNIGIGTITPTKRLDVAGDIQVSVGSDICISGGNCLSMVGAGSVTSVTGTAPIISSGGATPAISISKATSAVDGYLSSTDWNTFNSKQNSITTGAASQYLKGDLSLGTFATDVANTTLTGFATGANSSVTSTDSVKTAFEKIQGQINATNASIPIVPSSTDGLGEGIMNLYFTEARSIGSSLTGLSTATNADVVAADSVLGAIGKLQAQLNYADTDRTNYVLKSGDIMTGSLGIGGAANASAMLDIQSTTKGFLPPRMTTAQRDAIAAPATGLVIFNTSSSQVEVFNGSGWSTTNSFVGIRVTSNNVQAGNNTDIKLNMNAETFDVGNSFDLTTDRFQPSVAGKYLVTLLVHASGQTVGAHNIAIIYRNGATYESRFTRSTNSGNSHSSVTTLVDLNGTTDYIEPYFNLSAGSADKAVFMASLQSPGSSSGGGGALTADSVDGSHIQDGAISSTEIADGSIVAGDIAANTISVANLDFASNEGINVPQQMANPATGVAGQTYYNTTTNKMMFYNGTSWAEIGGTGTTAGLMSGWPDAIICDAGDGGGQRPYFLTHAPHSTGNYYYRTLHYTTATDHYFAANGNFVGYQNITWSDCGGKSISLLTSEGKAKYFGNQIATTSGDADNDTKIMVEKTPDEDKIRFDTAGAERMIIDNAGNVGIGTINPVQKLDVNGTARIQGDIIFQNTGSDAGDIVFQESDGNQKGRIWTDTALGSEYLFLSSGDTVSDLTIDPSGNVGIGVGTPTTKLDVAGTVKATNFQGTLNGIKMGAGEFVFANGACGNTVATACSISIASVGFTGVPACTITMRNRDATAYTEKMVIKDITASAITIWRGNYPDAGTTMQGYWTCMGN